MIPTDTVPNHQKLKLLKASCTRVICFFASDTNPTKLSGYICTRIKGTQKYSAIEGPVITISKKLS